MTDLPLIPHSKENEEAVIGSVLINPDCFTLVAQFLQTEDFYIHRNRFIWEAFSVLKRAGNPIDFLMVCEELERNGHLSEIGGPAYLTSLSGQVPTSLNAEAYARTVKDNSIRRNILTLANWLATQACNESSQTDKTLTELQQQSGRFLTISTGHDVNKLSSILGDVYEEVAKRSEHPCDVWGIPTGLARFDHETGGQQLGELTILAGEPAVGKTWLALGIAYDMAKHSPGAFFSLEMNAHAIARRLIVGTSEVKSRALRTGRMDGNEWIRLTQSIGSLETLPFYLDDKARDTASLRAALMRLKHEHGIEWFVADYIQLFTDQGKDDNERTKKIGRELKLICSDLELAGIAINSVNKQGMDDNSLGAKKSSMSGSGQLVHDADLVLFLTEFQPDDHSMFVSEEEKRRMATLWVKKGRELEEPRVRVHLVRKQNSPFWGELEQKRRMS